MSAYWYLVIGVVVLALVILGAVALSVLGRLSRLASEMGDLQAGVAAAQQLQARVAHVDDLVTELQDRVARLKS